MKYVLLETLKASMFNMSFKRSLRLMIRVTRRSTRAMLSISVVFKGQNGTRLEPPRPFSDVLKAAPVKGVPETVIVPVVKGVEANVDTCETCQLFMIRWYQFDPVTEGVQTELNTRR